MAEAWSVEVVREAEWDEYARSEAIAEMIHARRTCSQCRMVDSFVPVGAPIPVQWPDGRRVDVQQHRCLGCGAVDLVQRKVHDDHKDDEPKPGQYIHSDGLRMTASEGG